MATIIGSGSGLRLVGALALAAAVPAQAQYYGYYGVRLLLSARMGVRLCSGLSLRLWGLGLSGRL